MADTTAPTDAPQHPPHGFAVALSQLGLDTLTVTNAVADVADTAGENVTTAVRAEARELRADMNARIDILVGDTNARFAETNARIDTTNARLGELRADMNARFDILVSDTNARFAETNARIDTTNARVGELRADMNARFAETNARIDTTNARLDTTNARLESLQREMGTLRWMIGVGFTLLGALLALSTFLQSFQGP